MRVSTKVQRALDNRVKDWENIPSIGGSGSTSKTVRRADGKSIEMHKPGSQNRKKGQRGDNKHRRRS